MTTPSSGWLARVGPQQKAWLIVALLWLTGCSNFLSRVMVTTMHESITTTIPMTEAEFSLLTAVFLWVYGLFSPVAGFLADRFGRSVVIISSLLAWSAVTCLTAFATTFPQLVATRVCLGLSEACYLPAALALIADYHPTSSRSLATGVHSTGIMLGWALSGLGGWVAEIRSWSESFLWVGGISGGICLLLVGALRDAPRTQSASASIDAVRFPVAIYSLFSRRAFGLLLFYSGVLGAVGWIVVGWMPVYVQEHFHLTQGKAGWLTTIYVSMSALAGVLLGGAWADRWNRTHPRGAILVTAIGLLVAVPALVLTASTSTLTFAMAGLVLYGLMTSFSDVNSMPILCLVSDARFRATGYGVLNLLTCVTGGLAVFIGGALRDSSVSLGSIFMGSAVALFFSAILLLRLKVDPASVSGVASTAPTAIAGVSEVLPMNVGGSK